jgi:hypothetical protein
MLTPPEKRQTTIPDLDLQPICPDETAVFYPGIPPEEE